MSPPTTPPTDPWTGRVSYGEPITSGQAAKAILREIHSPILGDIEQDSGPGHTLQRIYREGPEGRLYDMLSGGERHLADIALALWSPHNPDGARLSAIGGLDPGRWGDGCKKNICASTVTVLTEVGLIADPAGVTPS